MDVSGLSRISSAANLQSECSVAMLRKTLSASEQTGSSLVQMISNVPAQQMEQSVNPDLGSNFDAKA